MNTSNIKKVLFNLRKDVPLAPFTTFRIGGLAKFFFTAYTREELISAVLWAKKSNLPFFILGGGSNLLGADEGFNGLVIKIQNSKFKIQSHNSKFEIICEAGTSLKKLALKAQQIGAIGLEWTAGIPRATVGGAIRGNAGAFGSSMEDIVKKVEIFDCQTEERKVLESQDCQFGYKESIFKKNQNFIVLSAQLQLKKGKKSEIEKKIKEYLTYRENAQPLDFPSAGSIFKNPKFKIQNPKLINKFPQLIEFNKKGMIPAGFLIEKAGLKGKKIGQAQISEKHANFIVNLGKARAVEVIELIKLIKKEVKNKFNIILEEEIKIIQN